MVRKILPKDSLLRKGWEYKEVYGRGKRFHGEGFTLVCKPNNLGKTRLGISIHRKIRGAVKRNRLKRIIRESFRLHRDNYPMQEDIVFTVRPDFSLTHPASISRAVAGLFDKVH